MERFPPAVRNGWLLLDDDVLLAQCSISTHRVRGPGGQHRNKTESGVQLVHKPSGQIGWATESRSQHDNRREAVLRLRPAIAAHCRSPLDTLELPEELLTFLRGERVLRLPRADLRRWVALATALDALDGAAGQVSSAAGMFMITTGQFNKLLGTTREIWQAAQTIRQAHGLPGLRG